MAHILYIEPIEGLASMLDKLESAEGKEVILLVPKGVALLEDRLGWSILQRHGRALGKELVVVAQSRQARRGARLAGFPVYSRLGRLKSRDGGQKDGGWRRLLRKRRSSGLPVALGTLSLGVFAFLALGAYLFFPTGTVALKPPAQEIAQAISVRASTQVAAVDMAGQQIPARLVRVPLEGADSLETSGRKASSARARGEVSLLNRTLSPIEVPYFALLTADGIDFITLDQVRLAAGGGTARVRVMASRPGREGNVGSMAINRAAEEPYASALAVWNEMPTYSGVEEEVAVVTAQDRSNLQSRLRGKLAKEGLDRLQALKKESESIYPATVSFQLEEESFDRQLGEEAATLTLRVRGTVSGLAFDGQDANRLARQAVEGQVRPGFRLLPASLEVRPLEAYDWGEGWVDFRLLAKGKAVVAIDGDQVAEALRGKNQKEAEEYLNWRFPERETLGVKAQPAWLYWAPIYLWKLEVR